MRNLSIHKGTDAYSPSSKTLRGTSNNSSYVFVALAQQSLHFTFIGQNMNFKSLNSGSSQPNHAIRSVRHVDDVVRGSAQSMPEVIQVRSNSHPETSRAFDPQDVRSPDKEPLDDAGLGPITHPTSSFRAIEETVTPILPRGIEGVPPPTPTRTVINGENGLVALPYIPHGIGDCTFSRSSMQHPPE